MSNETTNMPSHLIYPRLLINSLTLSTSLELKNKEIYTRELPIRKKLTIISFIN